MDHHTRKESGGQRRFHLELIDDSNKARPTLSADDQVVILDLLIDLLSPVGRYRSLHVVASPGKRAKRKSKKMKGKANPEGNNGVDEPLSQPNEKTPEILKYVTIGFNSTVRYLEDLAHMLAPMRHDAGVSKSTETRSHNAQDQELTSALTQSEPLAAVFIPNSDQALTLFAHLPALVRMGNLGDSDSMNTRLVMLPKAAGAKLSAALDIPRIAIIGLRNGAPMASKLMETVKARVPLVGVKRLEQVAVGSYSPVNIERTINIEASRSKRKSRADEANENS